jgi:hypothetical protein
LYSVNLTPCNTELSDHISVCQFHQFFKFSNWRFLSTTSTTTTNLKNEQNNRSVLTKKHAQTWQKDWDGVRNLQLSSFFLSFFPSFFLSFFLPFYLSFGLKFAVILILNWCLQQTLILSWFYLFEKKRECFCCPDFWVTFHTHIHDPLPLSLYFPIIFPQHANTLFHFSETEWRKVGCFKRVQESCFLLICIFKL